VSKSPAVAVARLTDSAASSATSSAAILPAEWSARLGHDLRGAIGPMRMAVQLLRSGRIDATDRDEALQVIDRQIDLLVAGIDDLTDLLRMAAGTFVLNSETCDLTLVLDVLGGRTAVRQALDARRQTLKCVPANDAVMAEHDPVRLAMLVEFLTLTCSDNAALGSELLVELCRESGAAVLKISAAGLSGIQDPDLAYLIGEEPSEAPRPRAILMREIARMSAVAFEHDEDAGTLSLRLPADSANR
jgi:K+-sensing histidine kinase KdpD